MNVLFAGATGIVGQQVVPILRREFDLSLIARGSGQVAGQPVIDVDITDFEALESVVQAGTARGERFDAIVNCAIAPYRGVEKESPEGRHRYAENCIEVNARGAYHLYEVAARARVPRVVFISSMTAVIGPPRYDFIDKNADTKPLDIYACTKVFGENIGRYYAYRSEDEGPRLRVICLRLGSPYKGFKASDETWSQRRKRLLPSHFEDIACGIRLALKANIQYGIYPIVSDSDTPYVDPSLSAELGYSPSWRFTSEGMVAVK
jgi:uronate dehydrogenase